MFGVAAGEGMLVGFFLDLKKKIFSEKMQSRWSGD